MGVRFKLHTYDFRALEAGIALEAAALMGVDAGRVLKTLMAVVDERTLVVTLVPAGRELNLKALAAAMGGKRAALADLKQAERASGYVKGGISPFGQRQRAPGGAGRPRRARAQKRVRERRPPWPKSPRSRGDQGAFGSLSSAKARANALARVATAAGVRPG
jgi:Aminoacyl-tRNA editing domain